ncbi:hypothetical protein EIL87_02135 [Saccharopolyspora rhizosphaerae]|uniref:Calcium-binding protein n=1 Tax=Saccharopolyspora rhizosphaerae TaxID=2492662 RepID=A0A426K5K8_9PSEU|nr:hypothetical protein [Saccharopolyspora rhizosphaerae]RRO20683.1 hypothetical protein EIL87_02135 [Saccharopolyspora rhizosphaerae]
MAARTTTAALGFAAALIAATACDSARAPGPPATPAPAPPSTSALTPQPPPSAPAEPSPEQPPRQELPPSGPNTGAATEDSPSSEGATDPDAEDPSPAGEGSGTGSEEDFQEYRQESGYPYSYEEHDRLPGYLQCGTACGQEPTSGEVQRQHLCERGILDDGC